MGGIDVADLFSDDLLELFLKLLGAVVAGLLLGLDREIKGHSAGLRTHALVAMAAAATAALALEMYADLLQSNPNTNADPLRIVEGLVAAVGFLGGGLILKSGGEIRGLTTAANLWACGIVGLAFGGGQFRLAILTLVFSLVVLVALKPLEDRFLPGDRGDDQAPPSS